MQRKADNTPESITFKNAAGDFHNDFRLMAERTVVNLEGKATGNTEGDSKTMLEVLLTPKNIPWRVQFEPTELAINRLKYQMQANSIETFVNFSVKDGKVRALIGDGSFHSGGFVFAEDVSKKESFTLRIESASLAAIFATSGSKTMFLHENGAKIRIESGGTETGVVYEYLIIHQTK
jgi:hypothetical protein